MSKIRISEIKKKTLVKRSGKKKYGEQRDGYLFPDLRIKKSSCEMINGKNRQSKPRKNLIMISKK